MTVIAIPGVGERSFDRQQLLDLHRACVGALESTLPNEDPRWREDPARARTSGLQLPDKRRRHAPA